MKKQNKKTTIAEDFEAIQFLGNMGLEDSDAFKNVVDTMFKKAKK
jgi:hypothetical protein